MFADHRTSWLVPVRSVLSVIVSPVQYGVSLPIDTIDWLNEHTKTRHDLIKQNRHLTAEIKKLNLQIKQLTLLQYENNQLRYLLNSKPRLNNNPVKLAQMLAVVPDPFTQQVIIDKGSRNKVYVGQPVVDANGVIGQVIQVGPLTSQVLMLNDSRSAVPVMDTRSGERAIAVGNGIGQDMSLIDVPHTADIQEGDDLVTSGLGLRFPVGYPVGKVLKVTKVEGEQFTQISLRPLAQLDRSRLLLLVWPTEQLSQTKKLMSSLAKGENSGSS